MTVKSNQFQKLEAEIANLEEIYTPREQTPLPTTEQQEMMRAFVVFSHAELEFYTEESCRRIGELICQSTANGHFTRPIATFLVFSNLPALTGGEELGGNGKTSRKLTTQLHKANLKYSEAIDDNIGIREKHIAKILVPLGLSSDEVDRAFLNDIDTLSSYRGRFAHLSRSEKDSGPSEVNPWEIITLLKRILYGPSGFPATGKINSFADLDAWFLKYGSSLPQPLSFSSRILFSIHTISASLNSISRKLRR